MANRKRKYIKINPNDGLENAILLVARADYEDALAEQIANSDSKSAIREVKRLERFFLSPWGQSLSFNCGELIIDKCRLNVLGGG